VCTCRHHKIQYLTINKILGATAAGDLIFLSGILHIALIYGRILEARETIKTLNLWFIVI